MASNSIYEIGIEIESKERLLNLVKQHCDKGIFDLNFTPEMEKISEDDKYPVLLKFNIDSCPIGFSIYSRQFSSIIDDGYLIQMKKL